MSSLDRAEDEVEGEMREAVTLGVGMRVEVLEVRRDAGLEVAVGVEGSEEEERRITGGRRCLLARMRWTRPMDSMIWLNVGCV